MALSSFVTLSVKISWDGSGLFTGPNDEVASYVRSLNVTRGRRRVNDQIGPGTARLTLRNVDGRFSVFNTGSPLYPLLPARPIRIQATYNAVTYSVFRGTATISSQNTSVEKAAVNVQAFDDMEGLRLGLTNTPIFTSATVDEIIDGILDDVGWPAGRRDLQAGVDTVPYFTNHNRVPLNALLLAATQEPGSFFFMAKDGDATWHNRYHRSLAPLYFTLLNNHGPLDPEVRQEDAVAYVRVTWPRHVLSMVDEPAFVLARPLLLQPGVNSVLCEANVQGVLAVDGWAVPVGVTDYIVNDQQDGSGSDKTAQVTFAIAAETGGDVRFDVTNLDSSPVWLLTLTAKGLTLKDGGETNEYRKDVSSPIVADQKLERKFEFQGNANIATGYADYYAAVLGGMSPRPSVQLESSSDALMVAILDAELGNKVRVTDTLAPWLSHVDDDFHIEGYSIDFMGSRLLKATWELFSRDRVGAGFFRISGALAGGQDYSVIATGGATSGYDRIAY